jgi:hypothetical protein
MPKLRDHPVLRVLRVFDLFGYQINFNVNGEEKHRTVVGASFSVLIFLYLLWILSYLLVDIVIMDKDRPLTTIVYTDYFGKTNQPLQQK